MREGGLKKGAMIAVAKTAKVMRLTFVAANFHKGSSVAELPRKHSGLVAW